MDRIQQSRELAQLTALELGATQAKFAKIAQREAHLRQNLAQLSQQKYDRSGASVNMQEAACAAEATVRWQQWVDQRRAVINTELAQVLALKENWRAHLTKAYGRDQAAQTVIKRLVQARKVQALRRQSYES